MDLVICAWHFRKLLVHGLRWKLAGVGSTGPAGMLHPLANRTNGPCMRSTLQTATKSTHVRPLEDRINDCVVLLHLSSLLSPSLQKQRRRWNAQGKHMMREWEKYVPSRRHFPRLLSCRNLVHRHSLEAWPRTWLLCGTTMRTRSFANVGRWQAANTRVPTMQAFGIVGRT